MSISVCILDFKIEKAKDCSTFVSRHSFQIMTLDINRKFTLREQLKHLWNRCFDETRYAQEPCSRPLVQKLLDSGGTQSQNHILPSQHSSSRRGQQEIAICSLTTYNHSYTKLETRKKKESKGSSDKDIYPNILKREP